MISARVVVDLDPAEANRRILANLDDIVLTSLEAGATAPMSDAKRRAPVLSGTLRRSIHTERSDRLDELG